MDFIEYFTLGWFSVHTRDGGQCFVSSWGCGGFDAQFLAIQEHLLKQALDASGDVLKLVYPI
jgi:hypothetical protein